MIGAADQEPSVLHLLAPAPFGGLERVVAALVSGLATRRIRVGVAALGVHSERDHPMLGPLMRAGIPVHRISAGPRAYPSQVTEVRRFARDQGWALLHSHGYHADLIGSWTGRPRISTFHGFTRGGLRNRGYEWLQRRAARSCAAVVAVSELIRRELIRSGVASDRVHVIRNVLPPEEGKLTREEARRALGLPSEGLVAGWVGRLSREKGPDLFVEAMQRTRNRAWSAVVIGEGPMTGALQTRAAAIGLAPRLRWAGPVPSASRYFGALDLLVLTSRTEGTPMVLLEAMRAGVPVIATAVGGVPDVIGGDEAVLVEPDPGAIAAALDDVVANRSAARSRAEKAQLRYRRDGDYEQWLEEYQSIYRSVGAG